LQICCSGSDDGLKITYLPTTGVDLGDYVELLAEGDGKAALITNDPGGTNGHLHLRPDGNVRIGSDSAPTEKLHVGGKVKIDTIDTDSTNTSFLVEDGGVIKKRSGGATGYTGYTGPKGDTGYTGPAGNTGDQGDKYAIVKSKDEGYVGLTCVEMPETRFEDVIVVNIEEKFGENIKINANVKVDIDEEFLFICEESSIKPISFIPSSPCIMGASIENNGLILKFSDILPLPKEVVVKISGIRKGRLNKRFNKYTEEEANRNTKFWDTWKNDE
jgi:hypothetical protein